MKKIIFPFVLFILTSLAYSQSIQNYDEIKLDKEEDYKRADTFALQAATFLLSNPIDQYKLDRLKVTQFLIKWMGGTPDYTFSLDGATKYLNEDVDLMGLYMAAMTKFCLENKSLSKDQNKIKLSSWQILLAYCDNPGNNVKVTKKLKKLSEANKNGELEKNL
jgi:hypothetical protein